VCEGYSGGGQDGGQRRENGKQGEQESGEEELLQLFNHFRAEDEAWVVYPYRCTVEDSSYAGSLRILYSAGEKTAKKYVLAVRGREGQWHFAWNPPKTALKIYFSAFTPDSAPPDIVPREWIRKFRKHGLYSDDIIYTGEKFDGFCEEPEAPRPVNEIA
jgi:hypothetical protein